ncbi:MAG: hypothetical protein H6822_13985 [Planctomycetaceae bacterium]|nr:hypothetical protein [Planctomycetaceae bacterium]
MRQFSLRSFLLAVLAFCVLVAWLAQRDRSRRDAIQAIRKTGTRLDDFNTDSNQFVALEYEAKSFGTRLWRSVTQDSEAVGCHLAQPPADFGDDNLRHIEHLPELRELWLWDTRVTDRGLLHLRSLRHVKLLNLSSTAVTDQGLQNIAALRSLRHLSLDRTSVTDAGLVHLSRLGQLEYLSLEHTRISDAGLHNLASLTALSELWLCNTSVTDAGGLQLQSQLPKCNVIWGDL